MDTRQYPKWDSAFDLVRSVTSGGSDSFWWDDLASGVANTLDFGLGDRPDIFERAGRVVRSAYPNSKRVWLEKFSEVQILHILSLLVFEIEFCVLHLPEPPKKEVSKRSKKKTDSTPIPGAPLPPAPPPTL